MEEKTVRKLDKTRDYCIAGIGNRQFFGQDGRHFDKSTFEEVDISEFEKPKTILSCKFCGVTRANLELMREHLLALHKDGMEKPANIVTSENVLHPPDMASDDLAIPTPVPSPKRRGRPPKKAE